MAIIIDNDIITVANAEITVQSTATGFAKANVMNHAVLKRRWRMDSATTSNLNPVMYFDLGSAQTVAAVVLDDVNFDKVVIVGHASDLSTDWSGATFINGISATNLVTNGSFTDDEDPPSGWSQYKGDETLTTEAGGKTGNCLMITQGATPNGAAYQDITVVANELYKFTCYIKAGTEATYRVLLYDVDNVGTVYDSGELEETAGDWSTSVIKIIKIPTGCSTLRIILYIIAAGGAGTTMYYDEVSLYNITSISISNDAQTDRYKVYIPLTSFNYQWLGILVPTSATMVSDYTTKIEIGRVVLLDTATEFSKTMGPTYKRGAETAFSELTLKSGHDERITNGPIRWIGVLDFPPRTTTQEADLTTLNNMDIGSTIVFYENNGDTSKVYVCLRDDNYSGTYTLSSTVVVGQKIKFKERI